MAINYNEFFSPQYVFVDSNGNPLNGGGVFFYEASNHATKKAIYKVAPSQDNPAGIPWDNPIQLNAAGMPNDNYGIFGADDNPYYVEVRASTDPTSQLINSQEPFTPPVSSGGGSSTGGTTTNLIANNQFTYYYQQYNTPSSSVPASIPALAPGNWFFQKSNTTATDTITFNQFVPGQTEVPQNPINYFHYVCTAPGSGETYKRLGVIYNATSDIPGSGVSTLAGQTVTLQLEGKSTITSTITVNVIQNFGTGGSSTVTTPVTDFELPDNWSSAASGQPLNVTFVIPSISGKNIGNSADDSLTVSFDLPLNEAADVQLVNFKLEQTSVLSNFIADTVEDLQIKTVGLQIPPVVNNAALTPPGAPVVVNETGTGYTVLPGTFPATGMVLPFMGLLSIIPSGWIGWQDGTIGNASSGATIRANADTQALFTQLWNAASDANCPVSGGRGASAAADFAANKTIQLPRANGMVIGIAGTGNSDGGVTTSTRNFADLFGEENHTLIIAEMPSHDHPEYASASGTGAQSVVNPTNSGSPPGGQTTNNTGMTGGDGAHNTIQPTTWVNWIIKL